MNFRNFIGLFVIITVILGLVFYQLVFRSNIFSSGNENGDVNTNTQKVEGYLGWEKIGFFRDEEVTRILANEYKLEAENNKKGSIEMVSETVPENIDYLFPSSRIALEIYSQNNSSFKSETIFYSPIVVYSWRSLIPDLEAAGLVTQEGNAYILDLEQLVNLVMEDATWNDIGSSQLSGFLSIISTDPTKSNSGNMFSALVASILNGNKDRAVQNTELNDELKSKIQTFFGKMGLLESSSGDMFEKFLNIGKSTYPFAVGYESQLIEVINEESKNVDEVVTLYPNPTVWSEHEFIALNEDAENLMNALKDNQQFQDISWQKYGFRKFNSNINETLYQDRNIPQEIKYTINLPTAEVMEGIIDYLE